MSEASVPMNDTDLTDAQKQELETVYAYKDSAELTEQERATLIEMFDTPQKLVLVRKALGMYTSGERGLTIPSPDVRLSAASYEELGREFEIQRRSDERIRSAMFHLYRLVKSSLVESRSKEMQAENQRLHEESKREKENQEQSALDKRIVGENL